MCVQVRDAGDEAWLGREAPEDPNLDVPEGEAPLLMLPPATAKDASFAQAKEHSAQQKDNPRNPLGFGEWQDALLGLLPSGCPALPSQQHKNLSFSMPQHSSYQQKHDHMTALQNVWSCLIGQRAPMQGILTHVRPLSMITFSGVIQGPPVMSANTWALAVQCGEATAFAQCMLP